MKILRRHPYWVAILCLLGVLVTTYLLLIVSVVLMPPTSAWSLTVTPYLLALTGEPNALVISGPNDPDAKRWEMKFENGEDKLEEGTLIFPWQEGSEILEIKSTWLLQNEPEKVALFALFDYEQIPLRQTGTDISHLVHHLVPKGSNEKIELTLSVPNVPGAHKLWLYKTPVLISPADDTLKLEMAGIEGYEVDLYIGEKQSFPSPDYRAAPASEEAPDQEFAAGWMRINRDSDPSVLWYTEELETNQSLAFNIHVGHNLVDDMPYALLAFLDWEQIPLDGDKSAYFGLIGSERGVWQTLGSQVKIPTDLRKEHELQVLFVANPYRPHFLSRNIPDQEETKWWVETESQRVILKVDK